jgi:hypothetical protein
MKSGKSSKLKTIFLNQSEFSSLINGKRIVNSSLTCGVLTIRFDDDSLVEIISGEQLYFKYSD